MTDPVRSAIAATTAWLDEEPELGRRIAAQAIDVDPVGFLDALGGLWLLLADVALESQVDLERTVRDVALGVAQADLDDPN